LLIGIYGLLHQNNLIQNRKNLLKSYENCFIASEIIQVTLMWALKTLKNKFGKINQEKIIVLYQTLFDLMIIENLSEKDQTFNDNGSFFRFTSRLDNVQSEFMSRSLENFDQFKIVNQFIMKSENMKDFYDLAFCSNDGLDIRNRTYHLKVYKSVFLGSEAVAWIKEKYSHLGLNLYGATVLGECFRQLKAFDHTVCEHPLRDDYYFYRMREEEEFLVQILCKYEDDELFGLID
jgi:hypothetical protein